MMGKFSANGRRVSAIFLVLLLGGYSSAVTLQNVKITISPPQPDAQIMLASYEKDAKGNSKYVCLNVRGIDDGSPKMSCRLPSGKYKLTIYSNEGSFVDIEDVLFSVSGATTKTIKVKVLTPPPEIEKAAEKAFNWVVIKTVGQAEECGTKIHDPTTRCASFPMSRDLVQQWISLSRDLDQVSPWNSFGLENSVSANFKIAGLPYHMQLVSRGSNRSWGTIRQGYFGGV